MKSSNTRARRASPRDVDLEAAAALRFTADVHDDAHALGQVLHDREAEAGPAELAATRLVDTVEALEDAGQMLGGDAGAVVLNLDHGTTGPARRGPDLHAPALGRVLDRVVHEALDHAPQPIGVGDHRGRARGAVHERDALAPGGAREARHHVLGDLRRRYLLPERGPFSRLEARQL